MEEFKFIGLDIHKETIAVSVAEARGGEVRYVGEIPNTPETMVKLVRQLKKDGVPLSFCYEAGPCGYILHRQLVELGQACQVIAPSLIPRKPGDRVKTDRRDSLSLARLHRAGELTSVWVPDCAQEALRDLTRGREDLKHIQHQARQRLQAFLLRHGKRYERGVSANRRKFRHRTTSRFSMVGVPPNRSIGSSTAILEPKTVRQVFAPGINCNHVQGKRKMVGHGGGGLGDRQHRGLALRPGDHVPASDCLERVHPTWGDRLVDYSRRAVPILTHDPDRVCSDRGRQHRLLAPGPAVRGGPGPGVCNPLVVRHRHAGPDRNQLGDRDHAGVHPHDSIHRQGPPGQFCGPWGDRLVAGDGHDLPVLPVFAGRDGLRRPRQHRVLVVRLLALGGSRKVPTQEV